MIDPVTSPLENVAYFLRTDSNIYHYLFILYLHLTVLMQLHYPRQRLGSNLFDLSMYSIIMNGNYSNTSMR
jgi:hypothetical protein